jgi:hypothetical protein
VPAPDGGDDFVWIGGPCEGSGIVVGLGEEAIDGGLKVDHALEDAALEPAFAELGEEALDGVDPTGRGRCEVEGPSRMTDKPGAHLGVLVGGVIVDDGMDDLSGRDLDLDGVQEADELLMPVALHATADDRSVQDVERGEQGGRAVPLIVVGHGSGPALLHRQTRLGAVQGLDLGLLVHRQDNGVGRRIDIEPDDVADLGGELRVVRQLELAHPMRLQPMRAPDALDRADADTGEPGHRFGRPVGRLARRVVQAQGYHAIGDLRPKRGDARGAGLISEKAFDAFLHKPFLPAPDSSLADAGRPHDLGRARAGRGQEHDPCAPHVLLGAVTIRYYGVQPDPVGSAYVNGDACSHPPDLHCLKTKGIPIRTQSSNLDH